MIGQSLASLALTMLHTRCNDWPTTGIPPFRGRVCGHVNVRRKAALQELMDVFESDSDASEAIMNAASERGQWQEVLLVYQRWLQSAGAAAERVGDVYESAISGLMRVRQWEHALGLICDFRTKCPDSLSFWSASCTVERADSKLRIPIFQLLLSMCSQYGSWEQVLEILTELRGCPEAVTPSSVASSMTALTKQKQWHIAVQAFAESRDIPDIDQELFRAAMKACSIGHQWQQVIGLLAEEQSILGEEEGLDDAMDALCKITRSLSEMKGSKASSSTSAALAASRMLTDMRLRKLSPTADLYKQARGW